MARIADSPFNSALADARSERGLSVKQLAERTGFTPGFIRAYEECYKNPTMVTIFRLAAALRLTVTIDQTGVTIEAESGGYLLHRWRPST